MRRSEGLSCWKRTGKKRFFNLKVCRRPENCWKSFRERIRIWRSGIQRKTGNDLNSVSGFLYTHEHSRERCSFYRLTSPVQECRIEAISSMSFGRSIGFSICVFIPLSRDIRRSSSNALADRAIMGIFARTGSSSLRMARAASCPFMTGI